MNNNSLLIRVVKDGFGYWDEHHVGEVFYMPIRHITDCIQKGYIEIVVNNMGNNLNYDEPEEGYMTEPKIEVAQAVEPRENHKPLIISTKPDPGVLAEFKRQWELYRATGTPPEFKQEYLSMPYKEYDDETN
jgi:hypothetical protein